MSDLLEERKARVKAEWEKRFAALPGRPKKPWVGKTPQSMPPPDVRLRIVRTWDHTCYLTGIKITTQTPDMEHVIALEDGGDNAEWNIRPALPAGHRVKTAAENKARDKADRAAKKKLGIKGPKKKIESAPMPKAEPQKKASTVEKGSKLDQIRNLRRGGLAARAGVYDDP